jgi:hypothetical protein
MLMATSRLSFPKGMEDDQTPYVFSMPPHIDSEGDEVAAYVSVRRQFEKQLGEAIDELPQ